MSKEMAKALKNWDFYTIAKLNEGERSDNES